MIKTEVKQCVNGRYYKEITIDNSTFKTMSFNKKETAEIYGEYLINKLSERVDEAKDLIKKVKAKQCAIHVVRDSLSLGNLTTKADLDNGGLFLPDGLSEAYATFCIECDRKGMKPLKYKDYLKIC